VLTQQVHPETIAADAPTFCKRFSESCKTKVTTDSSKPCRKLGHRFQG